MKPKLIKVVITDDDQVMMDGKISPIGVMEEKMLLNDPRYDVTISKHGLFRLGWQDRQGTPIGTQAPRPVAYDAAKEALKVIERAMQHGHKKVAPVKTPPPAVKPVAKPTPPPAMKPKPIVNKGPGAPVTPHPITPNTTKVDKNPPQHDVTPIPRFNS
jgi:hypothetical protein